MDWELATLQPLFLDLFWGYYRTPEDKRDTQKVNCHLGRCEQFIRILNKHLEHNKYVSGGQFGLGDICVGTCFYRYFNMGLDVEKPEHVVAWYANLSERPQYQNVIQVPFDELKGRLAF